MVEGVKSSVYLQVSEIHTACSGVSELMVVRTCSTRHTILLVSLTLSSANPSTVEGA